MKINDWIKLIIWIIIFEAAGFLMGRLTEANIPGWYDQLEKSSLTPPGYVFSVVWSILYALMAFVSWILWENRNNVKIKNSTYLFVIQVFMNWAWTPLFFYFHWIGFSFIWIIAMIFMTGIIMINLRNVKKIISWMLMPYLLWLIFAAYLNGVIWMKISI